MIGFKRAALVALACLALIGVATYQPLTRGYIFTNIGTLFTWSGSAQSSWNGSSVVATCADFYTYVKNDGTVCAASTATLLDSYALAHAVNTVEHSPLVANNTFYGGSFSPWTSANTGSCSGSPFAGQNVGDEDGDNGLAYASSLFCSSTHAVITLAQTFSISGSPTAQTYSLWYKIPTITEGDPVNCTEGTGTASFTVTVNSTVVATVAPTMNNAWHQVSGTTTALASGSNSVTVTATLASAVGEVSYYNPRDHAYVCGPSTTVAQPISIDNVSLSAVY